MKPRDIFLSSLKRLKTPRAAVGSATSCVTVDLMERAGAAFPEAHLKAGKMAALAATVHTVLGHDNVMPLFSVVHESAALGCEVDWGAKNRMPAISRPLYGKITDRIDIPGDFLEREGCAVPLKALELLKIDLGGEVTIVGKVFGPWTLGYHLFGVENFLIASLEEPQALKKVLRRLLEVTVRFGRAQLERGADALTLADHCTRDLCSPETYRDFLMEIHRELKERLGCPLILHICGDTADRIPYIRETGIDCFHFDSKVRPAAARKLAGESLALMGGTSNFEIIRRGTPETIAADVAEKLALGIDIIGPECAVPLDAPYRNLDLLTVEAIRQSGVRA
ncbi:MAG: hypothetical protein A2Z86_10335 [Candidatus Glassbacteria bacterium GWA2_58_10]|uniref:Uroporphyrinogen decarboxylase (URO-D) domain-containing protein n=1 Tax=Candidatus Glassbacteria bacterium GWA2_58_10 TaxID=1817865 RepID=A0A1F5YDN0_9BACT|nr:MAG: hypothetical protein A2Z86_10335 [Candidatus Glassbacteria bacterium GWA2_58_10]